MAPDPTRIGRYQVERIIGRGAMGVVYLAFDPQIGRRIALKTVKPSEGARPEEIEESRARFLREAQAAGRLLHPNIVTIFDVFEYDGTLFIAMEYVEGVLLDAFCSKKSLLPPDRALSLSAQALTALDYAHRRGIIHRDIKPGNLMVVDGQTLKVMDFGLARDSGAHLTHSGGVIGTPHYMSPEQIQGKELDGRSDLFSMGVVLYELVTGERPFEGETISTVIYRVLHEEPPSPKKMNSRVPETLSRTIVTAMAKEADKRFATAADFREALLHPQEPDPVQSWIALETAPRKEGAPDPSRDGALPPPILPAERASKRHTLSRKYGRFSILALLIAGGAWLAIDRYLDYTGRKPVPIAPPPSQEVMPKALEVITVPPGAALYLDGSLVDAVTLAPSDARPHTIEARMGCLSATAQVTGASTKERITLTLSPGAMRLPVTSIPPGARILVNGQDSGLRTPSHLRRDGCDPLDVVLELDGYDPYQAHVDPRRELRLEARLTSVATHGTLKVSYPSGILQVYEGERLLGTSAKALSLPAGDHDLRLVDRTLRGTRSERVSVQSSSEAALKVPAFQTGRVFLYGKPANDGKVTVDGARLDDLPLNGATPLAVGSHQFMVVSPEGRRVSFAWDIRAGDQTRVVDFAAGKVQSP